MTEQGGVSNREARGMYRLLGKEANDKQERLLDRAKRKRWWAIVTEDDRILTVCESQKTLLLRVASYGENCRVIRLGGEK